MSARTKNNLQQKFKMLLIFVAAMMLVMVEGEPRWKMERPKVNVQRDMLGSRFENQWVEKAPPSGDARWEMEMKQPGDEAQKKMDSRTGTNYGCTVGYWCWKYCGHVSVYIIYGCFFLFLSSYPIF